MDASGGRERACSGPARVGVRALWTLLLTAASACADSTGPRWVDAVRTVPDSAHLEPGESARFDVRLVDQNGNELLDRAQWVEWSVTDTTLGRLEVREDGASVTALRIGQALLRAELGRGRGEAGIYVQPPGLATIEIVPSPVEVARGTSVPVQARLLDASGAVMPPQGFRISWQLADTAMGRLVTATGPTTSIFSSRAVQPGQTSLKLIVGDTFVQTPYIVR